jgi:hypothetical protein
MNLIGLVNDIFTCVSNRTCFQNVLRASGINMIEETVLEQGVANMASA